MVRLRRAERLAHLGAPAAEVDELLRRADEELGRATRPSRWQAEALEFRGAIALSRGQRDEAADQFGYARARWERLGDTLAVRAVDARLASLAEAQSEPAAADDDLVLAARPPGAGEESSDLVLAARAPESEDEIVVRRLWPFGGDRGRDAMLPAIWDAGGPGLVSSGTVVRIESAEQSLLALPWELAAERVYRTQPKDATVERDAAWLRWALAAWGQAFPGELRNDCRQVVNGRKLSRRVREQVELALPRGGRRPQVVIVKGTEQAESSWGYSHRSRGLDLMSSYLSVGWGAVEYTAGEARSLALAGRFLRQPADVLHLTGRMETSGPVSWFDTSEEELTVRSIDKGSGTDTGIFVTDVVGWLAEMNRSLGDKAPPPAVVLDPVVSLSASELDIALDGRNRFAADLYLDGMTMAVVAVGLANYDPLAAQQAWLDGVAQENPLEEVIRAIRAVSPPAAPPALFAPSRTFRISPV